MTAPDLAPKGVGELLDRALAVLRTHWRTIFGAAGIALFPFALLLGTLQAFYVRGFLETLPDFFQSANDPSAMMPQLTALSQLSNAASLAYGLAGAFFSVALISALPALLYGRTLRPMELLRGGWRRLLWYVLAAIVLYLIIGAAVFAGTLTAFFTLGISLLLVVPALVWLMARLSLVTIVSVTEDANPFVALRRSWTLTSGSAWRVAVFFVGITLLLQAVMAAVNSPAVIRQVVDLLTNASPDDPTLALTGPIAPGWKVMEGLLAGAASALAAPIGTVAWYLFYLDLRSRRDGMDLVARAAELAEDAA